jgi:hypothetical protein
METPPICEYMSVRSRTCFLGRVHRYLEDQGSLDERMIRELRGQGTED